MRVLVLVVVLVGCQDTTVDIVAKHQPRAHVDLQQASATLTQASSTQWSLAKVGSKTAQTITWQATATEGATVAGQLIINGYFRVKNVGYGGATIGNVVVNLQT
ncbi:MAG TPA: hypothetical protein VK427_25080, partial [Kofleriaceae bacterium]|nr:hypothetical protein [Kofleriaceae bacterium]